MYQTSRKIFHTKNANKTKNSSTAKMQRSSGEPFEIHQKQKLIRSIGYSAFCSLEYSSDCAIRAAACSGGTTVL